MPASKLHPKKMLVNVSADNARWAHIVRYVDTLREGDYYTRQEVIRKILHEAALAAGFHPAKQEDNSDD